MSVNPGRIGKYELQERLVSGAVGEIWKAFDTQQRRYVAIKIISINTQASTDFTPRFYREAEVMAALRHPNIVPVQDFRVAQSGSEAYIIMDYVEGPSLAEYLNATAHTGTIPYNAEIIRLLAPIADALDYVHQRNMIHGAVRPAVILLGKDGATSLSPGEPKLTDFGFNHIQNPLALSLNDVSYISPEIAQGFAGTNRSDVYSLGVILFEMCTGALPYQGETPGDILMQHIHGMPTSPALINPHIPPALTAVIMRSLARDPAARPPTAIALVTAAAKALNTSMPESISLSRSLLGTVDPPSMSGISGSLDTMNSPTYPSQLSQQSLPQASSVPPFVARNNTPVLPVTPTGSIPLTQTPEEKYLATPLTSQPTLAASTSTPIPTTPKDPSVTPQAPGQITPPPTLAQKRRPGWLYVALVAVLLLVLAGSAFGVYLHNTNSASPPQSTIVGHVFFMSSGLLSSNSNLSSNQGISDEVEINLQNLPNPQPGKLYYAWLLDENVTNLPAVLLGSLHLTRGQVTMTYKDANHNNLLANYGHFLVTEEDANPQPISPSLDATTWRYSAAFPTTPNPADTTNHFSLLDHLRHLLAQDPKLKAAGLGGGLDIWLFRNVTKVVEQSGSARDAQKLCASGDATTCGFLQRAVIRVLDYLDGSTYVTTDIPSNITTQVQIDPTIARVALLEFDPVHQQPPGYLEHIGNHLRELASSPGVSAQQRSLAIRIGQAINNVQVWLEAVHTDAKQLVNMDNSQLSQPAALSLLDDMLTQAKTALVGQFDPNTNTVKEGVAQIHDNMQGLATFEVAPCAINNGKNSCS